MDENVIKSLPKGLIVYENQVAGHNANPIGVLKSSDGSILKPLLKEPQSTCEVEFYKSLDSSGVLGELRKFTPQFRGTANLCINGNEIRFLKLEDMTDGAIKPCVMDVKIGRRTWAPDASEAKRRIEEEKYKKTRDVYKFCIPGYKVFNICEQKVFVFSKDDGKKLLAEEVPKAFKDFLNYESGHMGFLIDHYLPLMTDMIAWWTKQRLLHLYSSSLLFFYDAHRLANLSAEKCDGNSWIKIKMIDFAHAVPAQSYDTNYTDGLKSLYELFKKLRLEYT